MKTVPDLKELFKQAAEIAQQVPPAMQEAAFNRALEMLTTDQLSRSRVGSKTRGGKSGSAAAPKDTAKTENPVRQLVDGIDSTQHPGVASASKVLDRALMVLQIALKDHSIDGLSPGEIASVLTEKFRLNTSAPAVRMALGSATTLVNRIPRGTGYAYRIMGPGEDYLAHLKRSPDERQMAPRTARKPKKAVVEDSTVEPTPASKTTKRQPIGKKPRSTNATTSPARPLRAPTRSPKTAVEELIKSGYFTEPRSGAEVQAHLRNKKALTIAPDQLRVAMLRLVRDEVLERDQNADGQYEYTKPKS